jgi:O-antigen/teichoic acid export membrane protein
MPKKSGYYHAQLASLEGPNLMEGLGKRAFYGSLQMMAAQAVKFVAQIASVIILARLVAPEEFGLIAFITSIFVFINLFSEFGLAFAIVQKQEINNKDLNTIFYLSVISAFLFFILFVICGIFANLVFGDLKYFWITATFGAIFALKTLATIPQGLLRRQLKFGFLSFQEGGAFLVGVILSILIAFKGHGLTALMTLQFVPAFLCFITSWTFAGWMPKRDRGPLKEIMGYLLFGGSFTYVEMANTLCKHLDNLLIGKIWGMEILGQYNRAYSLMLAPLNQVMGPIGAVIIPAFSRAIQKKEVFEKWTSSMVIIFTGFFAPCAAFLMQNSSEIIEVLLGPNWSLSGEIFFWLALAVFSKPIGCLVYWLFVATGKMKQMTIWTTLYSASTLAVICIGVLKGPVILAALFSASEIVLQIPLAIYFLNKTKNINGKKWLRIYIQGIAFLAFEIILLHTIQENFSDQAYLFLAQIVTALISGIIFILCFKESRFALKYLYSFFVLK